MKRPKSFAQSVGLADTANIDAFSRLRVSDAPTVFDSQLQYGTQSLLWDQVLTGTGDATHLPNQSAVRMDVLADGDKVVRQTRQYHRYQPGKSQLIACTFVLGSASENVRRRVGYFDESNGIFVEQTSDGVSIVRRTFASGEAVDVAIAQDDWNVDTLDGSSNSGVVIDFSRAQILIVDLQWLGVGRVRVGFDIDGLVYYAHQFLNANSLATVYMTTANLPVRYEIEATGAVSGASMLHICSMVASEGGFDEDRGFPVSANNATTAVAVTTRRPVLSIRPKGTFNSIVNRGLIIPESVDLYATTNAALWELVYGGAVATTPSWTSAGDNSITEFDRASAAITGGSVIASGYLAASASSRFVASQRIASRLPITLDIAGENPIVLSVVATSISGTSNVAAAINWREVY